MADRNQGQVVARKGNRLIVQPEQGGNSVRCAQRKKLPPLAVGDRVEWEQTAQGEGVVVKLRPRNTLLSRPDPFTQRNKPIAANVDQIVLVTAPEPGVDLLQVDRILVAAMASEIPVLLVINKVDLLDSDSRAELELQLEPYRKLPLPLLWVSTLNEMAMESLRQQLHQRCSVLVGPSGAGKSSMIQQLLPDEKIAVGSLSEAIGKGKHTTSSSTFYSLPEGGALIDSPGIREFGLWHLDEETIRNGFIEFEPYRGSCRFHNCRHLSEPGCAIDDAARCGEIAASRLQHYRQLVTQL